MGNVAGLNPVKISTFRLQMKKIKILGITFILLGAVTTAIILFYPSQIQSVEVVKKQLTQPESRFFQWKGAEIHYTDEGQGKIWVMVHGFGGSHRNFRKLTDKMKANYRVIRMDLPGFGLSDVPQEYIQSGDYASLYMDVLSFLQDSILRDSLSLVGNSMGGLISWQYTATRGAKINQLVLLASAGFDMRETAARATRVLQSGAGQWLSKKGFPYWLVERNAQKCYYNPSLPNPNEINNNWLFWNRKGNIDHAVKLAQYPVIPDTVLLRKITVPVTVIWGREDQIIPYTHARRFQQLIPDCEVHVFPDCGHLPMSEKTDSVFSLIDRKR